jgi:hypothetical protein
MTAGRPSAYKEEYCDMIVEHFRIQPQIMKSKETYFADGTLKSKEEYPIGSEFPTFQNFADKIGVNGDTLVEWSKKYEEFSAAYARAKSLQEHIWLVNSMSSLYNPQFAQFFGKNCLGYKDKQEVEAINVNLNKDVSNLSDEDLEKELDNLR